MPRIKIKGDSRMKIRIITLVLTKNCNLSCVYCYEKHDHRDGKIMEFSTAQENIARYLEADDEFEGVEVDFFGGEPMLAFPLIRNIVEWVLSREWPKAYRFMIGTNGTVLNDEIKKWLIEHRGYVSVSLSIDGNKTAHNLTRDNSYDLIAPNIPFFMENWPNQPAKMTIIADTIPYLADSIIELEEMGMNFTANMAFEDFWGTPGEKDRLLGMHKEQLSRLVDYYAERPYLFPVSPLLDSVPEYLGLPHDRLDAIIQKEKKEKDCTRYCGAGHEMVTVDVDGQNYPCHRFLPWVSGFSPPGEPTNRQTDWKPDECSNCKLIHSCPTCAGFNWETHKDTGTRTTFHCDAYKLEVLASARLEAIRIGQRSTSELEQLPLEEKHKIRKRLNAVLNLIEEGV